MGNLFETYCTGCGFKKEFKEGIGRVYSEFEYKIFHCKKCSNILEKKVPKFRIENNTPIIKCNKCQTRVKQINFNKPILCPKCKANKLEFIKFMWD